MPNLVNRLIAAEYTREFTAARGLVFVSLAGPSVHELEALRGSLAERGVQLSVVRNKLVRRAFAERGLELPGDMLVGNVALAWGGPEAAVHAAKLLAEPKVKKAGKLSVRGAVLEGEVLSAQDAASLADIPDRDTLRAQLASAIQGPSRALAGMLAALPRGIARVLEARGEAAGGAGEEPAAA